MRHFLVCEAETASFSPSYEEPTHTGTKWIVNPRQLEDKKISKQQHLKSTCQAGQSAKSQTMKAALHFYLTVKSLVTKKNKKPVSFNSTVNTTFIQAPNLQVVYKMCDLDNHAVSKSLEKWA